MSRNSLASTHNFPKIAFENEDMSDDSTIISSRQITESSVLNAQPTRCKKEKSIQGFGN